MFDRILSNDSWNVNISFHRLVESINGVYSLWTLPWNDLLIRHSKHSLLDVILSFLVKYLIFWTRSSSVLLLYDVWWLNHVTQSRAVLSCFTMFSHVSPCDLQCPATELFPESRVPFILSSSIYISKLFDFEEESANTTLLIWSVNCMTSESLSQSAYPLPSMSTRYLQWWWLKHEKLFSHHLLSVPKDQIVPQHTANYVHLREFSCSPRC